MADKYLYLALVILIPVNVVLTYRNTKDWKDERIADVGKTIEVLNVLPKNENKELKDPKEVRQYVLEMARREKLNVNMVEKIGFCESRWDRYAKSRTGKYQGVWQISSIHNLGDDRLDVIKSTKWSLDKMKREGYSAWSCSVI